VKGAPWHCGFPMMAGGGNQAAGADSWLAFRCENCAHQEVMWGHVARDPDGVERFVAQPRKTLTVFITRLSNGVRCRGVSQDADLFNNTLPHVSIDQAVKQIGEFYSNRGYRCVFNLPKGGNE
jgi:hypothetical protein